MIIKTEYQLYKILRDSSFLAYHVDDADMQSIGSYLGKDMYVCFWLDSENTCCNGCRYRFKCFTDEWLE